VYLLEIQVKFVYKGHRVKVKVTGAEKIENPYSRNVKAVQNALKCIPAQWDRVWRGGIVIRYPNGRGTPSPNHTHSRPLASRPQSKFLPKPLRAIIPVA